MADDHPWAVLPKLVEAGILTTEQAADVVLGTTMYHKLLGELQSAVAECHSKNEDTISTKKLYSIVTNIQMRESPAY